MSVIDQIKNTIPIIDALERYAGVNLSRVKINKETFNINCPYHVDHSPSFTVYTITNTFHCWAGCNDGKSGSVIDIVMLSLNVGVKEALNILKVDYGLGKPNSKQAKTWRTKRAVREYTMAQKKQLNRRGIEAINKMKKVELMGRNVIARMKKINDLDQVGGFYHLITQIEYWLDCLIEDDADIKIGTLQEINRFLEQVSSEGGESSW